ncbi:hypothetical protein BH20ACT5_BH20ACT5_13770 [soil metagenome]
MQESWPADVTRRGFLVLGGSAAGVAVLGGWRFPLAANAAIAPSSTVLSGGFPRVIAFRQSETLVADRSYSEWAEIFSPFSGIIGKALQEELTTDAGPQNVEYFTRFKQDYPDKLVLLHFNGRGRVPTFETDGWSAGWWLYRAGSVLTAPVGPEDTVFDVSSTSPFRLRADTNGDPGDDIVIAAMGPDGKPDFTTAEQVRLSGKSKSASTLTVLRGRHGTSPLSFPAGAYLAPHVYTGPWSEVDDRVWLYNFATTCPRDSAGRNVVDALLEQLTSWFGPGGTLAAFDGLELDVFQLKLDDRGEIDADCDGVVDRALQDGVDTYLTGQIQLSAGLRQILGPGRYLLTDGGVGQQPDSATVNGIELEGFPKFDDYGITRWSQALMTLEFWRRHGTRPRLSYPLYKFAPPNDFPVSYNRFRLTLAASLATDSIASWYNEPGGDGIEQPEFGVFDEYFAGTAGKAGWLGRSLGDVIHLAERAPDLLAGSGVDWSDSLLATFIGPEVTFTVRRQPVGPKVLVVSGPRSSSDLSFTIPGLALDGPDVVIALDLRAHPRAAYASTIGRQCTVTVAGAGGRLAQTVTVPTTWFHAVLGFHGLGPGPIDLNISIEGAPRLGLRGLRVFAAPDTIVREFSGGAMFANPSKSDVDFDVVGLFPGRRFVRITGSHDQDPVTNDGTALGQTLTLGALDGLVVAAVG